MYMYWKWECLEVIEDKQREFIKIRELKCQRRKLGNRW